MNALLDRQARESRVGAVLRIAAWVLPGLCAPAILMVAVQLGESAAIDRGILKLGTLGVFGLLFLACACFDTVLKLTREHGADGYPAARFARNLLEFVILQLLIAPVLALEVILVYLALDMN